MADGESRSPLAKKLGYSAGFRVALVDAPPGYDALVAPLPAGVVVVDPSAGDVDLVHAFVTSADVLDAALPGWIAAIRRAGTIWVSWPKRASGVRTDLSDEVVRRIGLAAGVVDVKVCAVDAVWSGLKFVIRVRDR